MLCDKNYQKPLKELKNGIWDVVISGAGPAGASLACLLAEYGHRVLLIDKESFPKNKICGDYISPESFPLLKDLEVDKEIFEKAYEIRNKKVYVKTLYPFPGDQF